MKVKHSPINITYPQLKQAEQQSQEVKFDLFVQSRKAKQIAHYLEHLVFETSNQDHSWIFDSDGVVNRLFNDMLDESMLALDGVQLDPESLKLSVSLISDIRKALSVVEQLSYTEFDEDN
jgi:hypothetical protein